MNIKSIGYSVAAGAAAGAAVGVGAGLVYSVVPCGALSFATMFLDAFNRGSVGQGTGAIGETTFLACEVSILATAALAGGLIGGNAGLVYGVAKEFFNNYAIVKKENTEPYLTMQVQSTIENEAANKA